MMAVLKDGEILAVRGEIVGESSAGQCVGEGIRGETRRALLAV
jgi:hypothetical protein